MKNGFVQVPEGLSGRPRLVAGKLVDRWKSPALAWAEKALKRRRVLDKYFRLGGRIGALCDEHEWIRLGFTGCRRDGCSSWRPVSSVLDVPALPMDESASSGLSPAAVSAVMAVRSLTCDGRYTDVVWLVEGVALATDGYRIAFVEIADGGPAEPVAVDPACVAVTDRPVPEWPIRTAGIVLDDPPREPVEVKALLTSAKVSATARLTEAQARWDGDPRPVRPRWSSSKAYKAARPTLDSTPIEVKIASRRTYVSYGLLKEACRAPFVPGRAKGDLGLIGIGNGGTLYVGPAWGSYEIVMPCLEV